ncbi:MAG: RNA polymerase subunit sigma-24 [Myxococcaceae bacterium]|nr:RNA polymerase subunit sigma-24 [Myxococcaceae bacterium]
MSTDRALAEIVGRERRLVLASLARRYELGVAEDAVDQAIELALVKWRAEGLPPEPGAWLHQVAQRRAIDAMRQLSIRAQYKERVAGEADEAAPAPELPHAVQDDPLRLVFTCCHPALAIEAQVALALRLLLGLSAEEIARAFLVSEPTLQQRLVRAKQKIRDAGVPYSIPERSELPERIEAVAAAVYLVFNEGYVATRGELARADLTAQAIRLGELLVSLMPAEPLPRALLALMLLIEARREARSDGDELVLLSEQDRSKWDVELIARGKALLVESLRLGAPSSYAIEASIQAVHADAARAEDTDWEQIVRLYAMLRARVDSPVVRLNEAAAISMAQGPRAALERLDLLKLEHLHLYWSTRADCLRRLAREPEAIECYERALTLTTNDAERRFLEGRIRALSVT